MKKQLLINISAFIVTAMLISASANAQIVYTDVIPDVVRGCNYPSPCGTDFLIDLRKLFPKPGCSPWYARFSINYFNCAKLDCRHGWRIWFK